jgi:hypothetical protein
MRSTIPAASKEKSNKYCVNGENTTQYAGCHKIEQAGK